MIIIALVIIAAVLIFKLWQLKKNIREIRKELIKTEDEDYNRQLKVTLSDRDLEQMAAQINENLDYQKSLKLKEEKSRRQLERSVSDIAHDLRTPLTVVKGNLQMLEKEPLTQKGREYLEVSSKKAEALKEMVDEFFELSVLESDSRPAEMSRTDIIGFLSEFILENETLIRHSNLTPIIAFPEKTVYILADRKLLIRVFSNLMGNIIKYAKDSFELTVTQDTSFDRCHIRIGNKVSDPGSIDTDHIFDRTYRADRARSDEGAGLGLYIARLLVNKQNGDISAVIEEDKLYFDLSFELGSDTGNTGRIM